MRVKEEYQICDRCKDKINERWHKRLSINKFKKRWFFGEYAVDSSMDLCGKCNEKFERFMDMEIDDNKSTEYEDYYEMKKERKA